MQGSASTKVIAGALYARSPTPYADDVRVHDLGHGHVEASALPRYAWHEVEALSEQAQADLAALLADPVPLSGEELLDKLARNKERCTRRARTQVRRLSKSKGLSVLLTLTYRENMTDRARMARDFDVFVKRVRRVIPGFQYVCVFERQKRGAWHAHIAVQRVQVHYQHKGVRVRSYDLLRSMWRAVVGIYDGKPNGNIDVSRNRKVNKSAAKLAAYLSKYIGKTFGDGTLDKYSNSYSASGAALPPAVVERIASAELQDAMGALVDLLSVELASPCEFHHALLDGGGWFVSLSPPDRGKQS